MQIQQTGGNSRHVIVAGGSFAGLAAAYTLRERLAPPDRVTLISPLERFTFSPSLIWAALGQPLRHSAFALEPALEGKGIDFVKTHVRRVRIDDHTVTCDDGVEMTYDRLVIATGGRPDNSAVPGLAGEFRAASWIVNEDSALEARNVIRNLYRNPGPLVIGIAPGAAYLSVAYELALALDTALRTRGIRTQVPITFVTPEEYLGHLGLGQTAAARRLSALFAERGIATRVGAEISSVQRCEVKLAGGERLPVHAAVIMPPFTGDVDIWKSAKLTDDVGMIPVTGEYRHVEYPDIYAAGVASSFRQPLPPLGTSRAPQTGYLATHMGKAAGQNVAASLGRGQPASRVLPSLVDIRVIDGGSVGLFIASRGDGELRHTAVQLPGKVAHTMKASIERYLLWRLRTGRMDLP
jgi:sulfide:quinone oxidoreductase